LLALSRNNVPTFVRGAGALFVVAGLALAYLAGRTRARHAGFRRATLGLALALVVLLAIFSLIGGGIVWLLIMILSMVGAVLVTRPAAQDWFDTEARQ
jgi:fatty acid desaturase